MSDFSGFKWLKIRIILKILGEIFCIDFFSNLLLQKKFLLLSTRKLIIELCLETLWE